MGETKKSCGCCGTSETDVADAGSASCEIIDGVQEARITVKGGYDPKTVNVKRGVPTRLVFSRQESSRCSEELLVPEFGIREKLPQHVETIVEFTPSEPGIFAFTCGMQMLRGEIVVN